MSRVNVSLKEFFTTPGNVLVSVKSELIDSQSVLSGTIGVLPGEESKRTSSAGVAVFDLMTGRYLVSAKSSKAGAVIYAVTIDVPDDSDEYEHTELIAEGAGTFTPVIGGGSPNATDASYGLVRLSSGGYGIPETVDTIALARAIASSRLAIAKMVGVLGGAAAFDGLGGIYAFVAGNTDADDGAGTLRPNDYTTGGTLKKFL